MPVEIESDRIVLKHPEGPSVEILLYGATVVSWKVNNEERFFVSSKAILDGSKPVRGGIPIVFPAFGAPTHEQHLKLPQHGFARSEVWTFDSIVMDTAVGVSVRLVLKPTEKIQKLYSPEFDLVYVVTLAAHQLSTDLHVTNPSKTETLEFQGLLHNYIRAPSKDVAITPLKGLHYYDKTDPTETGPKTEHRTEVTVTRFTDSVYENAPDQVKVSWPNGGLEIKTREFKNIVVWNPQSEAGSKMADMEAGGWDYYVCVEPGTVRGFVTLEPGKRWIGGQVLSIL